MSRFEYAVHRCTYDKLKDYLINLGADGWRVTPHFVGGRDWVLTSERAVGESLPPCPCGCGVQA